MVAELAVALGEAEPSSAFDGDAPASAHYSRSAPMLPAEAWRQLLDGAWSVVERFDRNGRRFWIARESSPAEAEKRCLNELERSVVSYLVGGASQKRIAVELRIAESTVSKHAATARSKLGLRTCAELIELCGTLGGA
jgi:DNA-binding CsgD family transcriptional regulator